MANQEGCIQLMSREQLPLLPPNSCLAVMKSSWCRMYLLAIGPLLMTASATRRENGSTGNDGEWVVRLRLRRRSRIRNLARLESPGSRVPKPSAP